LIEGPPGTSKSTLLCAITAEWGVPLLFVEGNADLTPAKLIGHHNPARVLREDYSADNFVDGPLLEAIRGANAGATGDLFERPRHARLCGGGQSVAAAGRK
jgi:MoxR-like ATPase